MGTCVCVEDLKSYALVRRAWELGKYPEQTREVKIVKANSYPELEGKLIPQIRRLYFRWDGEVRLECSFQHDVVVLTDKDVVELLDWKEAL